MQQTHTVTQKLFFDTHFFEITKPSKMALQSALPAAVNRRCEETKLKASDFTAPSFLQQLCGKMLKKSHTSPYPKGTAL